MYRHVLLTLDGSPLSRMAIAHAHEVAAPDAKIVAVEVVPTPDMLRRDLRGAAYEFTAGDEGTLDKLVESTHFSRRQEAIDELAAAARLLEGRGAQAVQTAIREGLPGNEILAAAAENGSEVIVMATRGHSGLGREIVGSVAEYVLRHAGPAAVLLIGPRAAITPPPGAPGTA